MAVLPDGRPGLAEPRGEVGLDGLVGARGEGDTSCAAAKARTAVTGSPFSTARHPPTRRHWASASDCPVRSANPRAARRWTAASLGSPSTAAARARVMVASRASRISAEPAMTNDSDA